MHWIIQKSIFKPENYQALTDTLACLGIEYTSVNIPNGTCDLVPDVHPVGKVYVCGAIKMRKIAEDRQWQPGSFLNDNFRFDTWLAELGDELLNSDVKFGIFKDIPTEHWAKFFIRPLEDNKAFDGMVIDNEMLRLWRNDPNKAHLANLMVAACAVKDIYREYRLFVVKNRVITGSVYKIAGRPQVSETIEPEVVDYVTAIINRWAPAESCVVDICLTENGYKVIEFNNINSSGFYASNLQKYVEAIELAYA